MKVKDDAWLVAQASRASRQAYIPYSNFAVGAALIDEHDDLHTGCNVENASYGATRCAEQVALLKAVSEGSRSIKRLAVAAQTKRHCMPCGICRQMIQEFAAPDFYLLAADKNGGFAKFSLQDLLPHAFGPQDLEPNHDD